MAVYYPYYIPIEPGVPYQSVTVQLDGSRYTLSFKWNERLGMWFMGIVDVNGDQVRMGQPLPVDYPISIGSRQTIPGYFMALDRDGNHTPPGISDFGTGQRVELIYLDTRG